MKLRWAIGIGLTLSGTFCVGVAIAQGVGRAPASDGFTWTNMLLAVNSAGILGTFFSYHFMGRAFKETERVQALWTREREEREKDGKADRAKYDALNTRYVDDMVASRDLTRSMQELIRGLQDTQKALLEEMAGAFADRARDIRDRERG